MSAGPAALRVRPLTPVLLATALLALLSGPASARAGPPPAAPDTLRASAPAPGLLLVYWPGGEPVARRLAAAAATFPPLPGLPDPPLPDTAAPVLVQLAPDPALFDSLTGGAAPVWSAGVTFEGQNRIVLPAYTSSRSGPRDLRGTLRHELAHALLHRYLGGVSVPRWFDEGYAQFAAGEFDAAAAWQIRLAFALHRAPPLDSLSLGWPGGAGRARLAYLLSATVLQYLVEQSGDSGLRAFLRRWKRVGNMDQALRGTYGVTLGQLEQDWGGFVRHRYGWAFFFSQAVVFWFFASILLVVFWLRRRRINRGKLARLRASEPPDQPAYWLGADVEAPETQQAPGPDAPGPDAPGPDTAGPDTRGRDALEPRGAPPAQPRDETRADGGGDA